MPAILFGSISTLADTSELQRAAFNRAFESHGLDWTWDREEYVDMLATSGGRARVEAYAEARGESVDAQAVHASKSRFFQEQLAGGGITPRAGVLEVINAAGDQGWKLGLVTTTSPDNVAALLAALGPDVQRESFDVIVDSTSVGTPKPDRGAYTYALERLNETPTDCVAIEDNPDGVSAATAAGVPCLAFPNENTAGIDFAGAERRVERLAAAAVQDVLAAHR